MSALQPYPLVRTIYKEEDITLTLYIPPPETYVHSSKYQVNYTSILYLQLYKIIPGEDVNLWKLRRYAIRPSNFYNVIVFFNTVLSWFEDPDKKDMYLLSPSGDLIFNSKYSELALTSKRNYFDDCVLKATPCIVEIAQGSYVEGIYLFINRKSNMVVMTKDRLESLFNVLRTFSFTNEAMLTFELLKQSFNCGKILTKEEYDAKKSNPGAVKW